MMDEIHYKRLEWLGCNPESRARPPVPLFGLTTWPQEIAHACAEAVFEIDSLRAAMGITLPPSHGEAP